MTAATDTSAPERAPRAVGALDAIAPSPAVAPPPGNPRFPLFDSLRAIAVLAVVVFHVAGLTGALAGWPLGSAALVLGACGPLLFFVISGFLLYRPFVAARVRGTPPPRAGRYARRRALRILPAYWLALTVLAVFPGIVGAFTGDWWRYYLFLQLYSDRTLGLGIPVAWTLCVEVAFYAVLPAWALAMRRWRPLGRPGGVAAAELAPLAAVAAAGVVVQVAASRQDVSRVVASSIVGQAPWLGLGMALAIMSVATASHDRGRLARLAHALAARPGRCWLVAAASFAGLVALAGPGGPASVARKLSTPQPLAETCGRIALTGALLGLLVVPAVFGDHGGGLPRRVLALRPLLWLGLVSYGVYIWHLTIAELVALPADPQHFSAHGLGLLEHVGAAQAPVLFIVTMGATLVVAAASYRFVELPFLRRKER